MTEIEKLDALKLYLGADDTSDDLVLVGYLRSAAKEIISWKYGYVAVDRRPTAVPADDEQTQIWAVVAGFSIRGAENQKSHNENGISRNFAYPDMIAYIRSNVIPYVGVL